MSNEDVVEDEGEKAEEAEVVKAKATVEEKGDEAGVESEGNANDNTE